MDIFSTSKGYTDTGMVLSMTSFTAYFAWHMFHEYFPLHTQVTESVFVIFSNDSCDITPEPWVKYIPYREYHIDSEVG
jgi:hypothetical protein